MRRPPPAPPSRRSLARPRLAPVALTATVVAASAACGPAESSPPAHASPIVALHRAAEQPTVVETAPAPRADGRIVRTITPLRYTVELEVDPRLPTFRGHTRIRAEVPRATSFVLLHGRQLRVTRVVADTATGKIVGHASTRRSPGATEDDELVLRFDRSLPAGEATLAISYESTYGEALAGLYRVKDGGEDYAFTQFEATDARRAFPCIDEPDLKVPFDVVVKAPRSMVAVSNMPEAWRTDSGDSTIFAFQTTPPLPTYLLALAVGHLDVQVGRTSPFPVRLVTTHGKAALGAAALDRAARLVDVLGDYFGIRYPYPKLDIVAVPDFAAGAMENAGLVTFREEILLQDPKHPSTRTDRNQALTVAHELAHQWFGDLVTMTWWDDTWLNEGFASWMEAKAVDRYRPEYVATLEQVGITQSVMDTDALGAARRVRQPVRTVGEIDEAFDGITYDKGAAFLRMLEGFVGEATFQRGVSSYLRDHAWGNATAADLIRALEHASGKPLAHLAATFLDQTGVPNVDVERECDARGYKLTLTQFPWAPVGAAPPPQPLPTWDVPVCMLLPGLKAPRCEVLDAHTKTIEGSGACPTWIAPNASERGYYRFQLPTEQALAFAKNAHALDAPSRVGAVSNLWAMARSGAIGVDVLLRALPMFDHDTEPYVVEQIAGALDQLDHVAVSDADRRAFRAYVVARLGARAKALGWAAKPGEAPPVAIARRAVLHTLGDAAADPTTHRQADALVDKWLHDPAGVDPDAAATALEIGPSDADVARFDALLDVARKATLPQTRVAALRGLGSFDDPKLLSRALDLTLTDDVKQQDARYILRAAMAHRASRPVVLGWVRAHWDVAIARFTSHLAHPLLDPVWAVCTKEGVRDARAFFAPRIGAIEGGDRPLAEALERAGICADLRGELADPMARYLTNSRDGAAHGGSSPRGHAP